MDEESSYDPLRMYWRYAWRNRVKAKFFSPYRAIPTVIASIAQFVWKHKTQTPKTQSPFTEMWVAIGIIIAVYLVLFALESFWRFVVATPPKIYDEQIEVIEKHIGQIGALEEAQREPQIDAKTGPDVMIEYAYTERREFPEQPTPNASAPLVLVNASPEHVAKNVRILPLTIGELNAKFEPDVLPYIEAKGEREVKVVIDKIFPTLRHDLPLLFARAYKDTSSDELFMEVPYIFLVQYEDATNKRLFETSVTFLYQRWKNTIRVGETKRTLKQSI